MIATNRLGDSASPYLRSHAGHAVAWQPWDETALALARTAQRPILLSIGYSACHWCHVMARESFEDPATASVMNELFVCIKVDREERPDLDRMFLGALAWLGCSAGWPLTAFLTAEGTPYAGGGYFPREPAFGLPAFADVLRRAAGQHGDDPAAASRIGREAVTAITAPRTGSGHPVGVSLLDRVANELARSIDWLYGGFGTAAPKFLHPGGHEMLLRAWARTGVAGLLGAALTSVGQICNGAVYDHVGGGFHRYAVDDRWRVPHFEKMLGDNAVMLRLLVRVWQVGHDPIVQQRIEGTVAWLLREMVLPNGSFAASLASDAAGEEGAFYTWAPGEISQVLGERYDAFAAAYGEGDDGAFGGRVTLYRETASAEPACSAALAVLFAHRLRRSPPARDGKILADWNGLAIAALAEAGLGAGRPDWILAARAVYDTTLRALARPGGLAHSAFDGQLGPAAFLDDYANMAQAALCLYETSGDEAFVAQARSWVDLLDARFWDNVDGGYFLAETASGPGRLKLIDETTAPAGNGTMIGVLARLAVFVPDGLYRHRGEAILRRFGDRLSRTSLAAATALNNVTALDTLVQVVIMGEPGDPARDELLRTAAGTYIPDRLLIPGRPGTRPPGHPVHGKIMWDDQATAYVCRGPLCLAPVTDATVFAALLTSKSEALNCF